MKYLTLKGIFCISLFSFSTLIAQELTVINKTTETLTVRNNDGEILIGVNELRKFSETSKISCSDKTGKINRSVLLFLEPTEKLIVILGKENTIQYTGDNAALHEYINEKLNTETFDKINSYEQIGNRKAIGELKNTSELLLMDVLKKVNLKNIIASPEDKDSVKRLKNYVKYNWLYTIFSTINHKDKIFKQEAINYYYKKYIETDIPKYNCNYSLQYHVIETLAKNKRLIQAQLPVYPIIEHTDDDETNQYLPLICQREYFRSKYKYLESINGHNKEYYKKVLIEKFNE